MKQSLLRVNLIFIGLICFSATLFAQMRVAGTVKDAAGEPLIGASLTVKGTTTGTITDVDGSFSLEIPGKSANVEVSYTGYRSKTVQITADNTAMAIVLEDDVARLDEVLVTGLASGVKRANSGNAVTSITGDELVGATNPQTLDNALFGKIPGVNMSSNSGAPGGGVNVQLRGVSTLGAGSSQPLYIIDGVYVDNSTIRNGRTQISGASGGASVANQDDSANRIADINPDDIEKIEVLKGPSAAAIYGTRANSGVIIITTKRGAAGKTKVSLSQDLGMGQGQNFQNFDTWNEAKINTFFSGARQQLELQRFQAAKQAGRENTNWEDFFYGETALLSNTQLSISGGNDKTQFFASGGVLSEDGIIKNTGFERYTMRANIDQKLGNRIKISISNNYTRSNNDRGFTGNQNNTGGSIGYALAYTPSYADLLPDATGNYPNNPYFNDNPVAIRDLSTNNQKVDRFISAGTAEWDILQNTSSFLKLRVNGGVDYLSSNTIVHFPEVLQHQRAQGNQAGDVMWGRQDNLNTNLQAFLIYNADLGSVNSNTAIGISRLDQQSDFLLTRGRGLNGGQTNLTWARVQAIQGQVKQTVSDVGLVAQQDINWQDRITASVGIRLDKSTLNAQQDKYYAFPKASLALNLANFDFWNLGFVNQFKLRAAYGQTGGLPNFGVTFESLAPQIIGGLTGGQVGTRGVDPNLTPETAEELEFGLDAGFLKNRITLEATYYNKGVKNLILDLQPAESTGILAIATNAADLENKGIELGLGITPVRTAKFNWYTKLMYWQNRSVITRLDIPVFTTGGFGASLGTYLISEGFSPTTIVGNPVVANSPQTSGRTVYGDRQPDFQMSWLNSITFLKNFDLNWLFHYQKGGEAINLSALLWDDGGTTNGWSNDSDGDGTPDGLKRLTAWSGGNTGVWIEKTDYIKLREVALYYTLPKDLLGKGISRAKIGVSGNNILLWTNYGSYDPEVSNFGSQPVSSAIEVTPYPSSRRLFFHLKFDF